MSHLYGLGKFCEDYSGTEYRDAMHVAVIKVTAFIALYPGQKVRVWKTSGGMWWAENVGTGNGHGIVDPFLSRGVKRNEEFLVILNPGSTNNLRHTWTHPDFSDETSHSDAEEEEDDGCRGCY